MLWGFSFPAISAGLDAILPLLFAAFVDAEAANENWATAVLLAAVLTVLSVVGYLQRDRLAGYLD